MTSTAETECHYHDPELSRMIRNDQRRRYVSYQPTGRLTFANHQMMHVAERFLFFEYVIHRLFRVIELSLDHSALQNP